MNQVTEPTTAAELARLEAEWRRLERGRLPGRLRAYQQWQDAVDRQREAPASPAGREETVTEPASVPTSKIGRLTRDPELRFGKTGTAVASFGLAVKPYVPKGEPEPETVFYEVVTFGGLAEHVAECLLKGDRAVVVGKGEVEHWKDRDGVDRTTKKIVADAAGPDLRFAGCDVHRAQREEPAQQSFDDEEPF